MLVEVDASEELVRNVKIKLPLRGGEYTQRVEFEYEPKFCSHCRMLGLSGCLQLKAQKGGGLLVTGRKDRL